MTRENVRKILLINLFILIIVSIVLIVWKKNNQDPASIEEKEKLESDENFEQLLLTSLNDKSNYDWIVVVNPAHGGSDSGYQSGEISEKDITLEIAKQMKVDNNNSKVGIFLTRETDTNPSFVQRNVFVEKMEADLFIDIHMNKDAKEETFGTSVYYQTDYFDSKVTNVTFADIVERNVVEKISGKANGIFETKDKQYEVLSGKTIPSISIECGYLSNSTEGVMLTRELYQKNISVGLLNAVDEALDYLR